MGDRRWDGEVTLKTDRGTFRYLFEVKTNLRPQTIRHLLIQADAYRKQWGKATGLLLLADYVNPSLGDQLKDAGINFIDTAGNLFLKREPGLYLYVEGKKSPASTKEKPTRLFQPSGLTLLFGLLVEPESINHPYRHLSEANGIALGTVGWVKRDLREHGYLEPTGKDSFRLVRKKDLLDRWVHGYASRLRPKVFLGEYRALSNDLDTVVKSFKQYALEHGMSWGVSGGLGADELVHHYRGNTVTLFVESWRHNEALKELKWLPVTGGPITALKGFSPRVFQMRGKQARYPVVHPLLIYAELLYQGSDRALETARLIYNEFLEPSLAKD
ncbi:MAG: type IV toxin-antitoxin system AbiEi family antitoxin [Nitrospiraceae bacterium]